MSVSLIKHNYAQSVGTMGGWPGKATTHRLRDGKWKFTQPVNLSACGVELVAHLSTDRGTHIKITCKRGGCR